MGTCENLHCEELIKDFEEKLEKFNNQSEHKVDVHVYPKTQGIVRKIIDAALHIGPKSFLVKWQGIREPDLIILNKLNKMYPQQVALTNLNYMCK